MLFIPSFILCVTDALKLQKYMVWCEIFFNYSFTFLPFLLHFLCITKISSLLLICFWHLCVSCYVSPVPSIYILLYHLSYPAAFLLSPLALFVPLFFDCLKYGPGMYFIYVFSWIKHHFCPFLKWMSWIHYF